MRADIRRRISRARTAFDFATAHPVADAGYATVLTRLQGEVAQADALARSEDSGRVTESAARVHRKVVRNTVRSQQLRRLCRIAARAAKDHPELQGIFKMPPVNAPLRTFIIKAQGLLDAAADQATLFGSLGLGDKFVDQLTAAIANFDGATQGAHAGRAEHVGATAQLIALAADCSSDVDVLDTFIQEAFAGDQQTLAGWKSAKSLRKFTPVQTADVPPEPPAVDPPVVTKSLLPAPPARGQSD
jgi:hypothetical protein